MTKLNKIGFLLRKNPALLIRKIYRNLLANFFSPGSVSDILNGVTFSFDYNLDPEVRKMYWGAYEVETLWTMEQFLKPGDTFIDVGANIGFITAYGSGLVGKSGQVHCFEPVPEYFDRLDSIRKENSEYNIFTNAISLGDVTGSATIQVNRNYNIGWNTMVPGFMNSSDVKESIKVKIHRLDGYLEKKKIDNVSLIKIDTEGFEFPVLKGLSGYLEHHHPPILCEIAPQAYAFLGYTLSDLDNYMQSFHYIAVSILDLTTPVDIKALPETQTIVFFPVD